MTTQWYWPTTLNIHNRGKLAILFICRHNKRKTILCSTSNTKFCGGKPDTSPNVLFFFEFNRWTMTPVGAAHPNYVNHGGELSTLFICIHYKRKTILCFHLKHKVILGGKPPTLQYLVFHSGKYIDYAHYGIGAHHISIKTMVEIIYTTVYLQTL
jgi:hypothetical protein